MRDNTKYSSYWLKDDLFDDDNITVGSSADVKHSNLLTLASYKRAISNFVNIVTNENIKVKFEERGDSYTDGNTVTISSKMDDKDFDPTVGLALHEGSHIKLTDFSVLKNLSAYQFPLPITNDYLSELESKHHMDNYQVRNKVSGIVKDLLNVIEDRRIDYYIYSTSPGYKGYYHSMYDKYFNAKIIDKGLKSSECRTNDWDSYMFRIINIINENRDLDALPMLRKVWELIDLKNINRLQDTQQSFKLACEVFKLVEDSIPPSQQQPTSDNGSNNENQSGDGDNSQTNGTDNTEGPDNDGESKQDSNGMDYSKGDGGGDEVKSGRNSYNPNGAGGDGPAERITEDSVKVTEDDGELSNHQKKQLDKAIKKQKDFQNGDLTKKKVSKSDNEKLETLSKAGIDEKLAGKDYQSGYWRKDKATPVIVVRNLTKSLIDSNTIGMLYTSVRFTESQQDAINKGIQIGTMLGKRLKVRSEERSLTTPRMKNGRISGRLLHELGMGNVQIFDQTVVNKHKPALLHISIDASSSMHGKKWNNAQTAAVAIAKAASMTSNLDVVISYRAIEGSSNTPQPIVLIAYDSRKDKFSKIQQLFRHISSYGTTPEGLCFEAILDDIVKSSNGIDSYFINFSDGWPGFSNRDIEYSGKTAVIHTANQVKKMQMAGVKVLSYFIEEGYYGGALENFKQMYGKSAEAIDVTSLIPLTRTLNKMFE